MYLHIGNNRTVRSSRIIGIFDADTATVSAVTKKYINLANAKKAVEFSGEELPKSFVLYLDKNDNYRICFSQLSSVSLSHRVLTENGN